ncbi:MAG: formylglycine-generating enzyme family protein [bacterium]
MKTQRKRRSRRLRRILALPLGLGLGLLELVAVERSAAAETVQSCRRRGCRLNINTYRCVCPRRPPRLTRSQVCNRRAGCEWHGHVGRCHCGRKPPRGESQRPVRPTAPTSYDRRTGITWITIRGGSFNMGDPMFIYTRPVHRVRVDTFRMAKSTVTVAQYRRCVKAGKCTLPPQRRGCLWGRHGMDNHPVNCVSWHQAVRYAAWAGGRLPSEAEWEYAARSGGKRFPYPWGKQRPSCKLAVMAYVGCAVNGPERVCSRPLGNTLHGLCDMAGNVWEWTADWHNRTYSGAPSTADAWTSGSRSDRMTRGGGWGMMDTNSRSTYRTSRRATTKVGYLGFRVVRSGP